MRNKLLKPSREPSDHSHPLAESSNERMPNDTPRHGLFTASNLISHAQRRRPSQSSSIPLQDCIDGVRVCHLNFDHDKQLRDENARLNERCERLKRQLDSTNQQLEEREAKLATELSRQDLWTGQARRREAKTKKRIEELEKQKEALYLRLVKNRRVHVSQDELRGSLEGWYSALATFCPKYFGGTDPGFSNTYQTLTESDHPVTTTVNNLDPLFYYERQSKLFESILLGASSKFLSPAIDRLKKHMESLEQLNWEARTQIQALPLYPPLIKSFIGDDRIQWTMTDLANLLHDPDLEQTMAESPQVLRWCVEQTTLRVKLDMIKVRCYEQPGRDDVQINKQLENLVSSLIVLLLNIEATNSCYKFVRIELDQPFDDEVMESVGGFVDLENEANEDMKVRLAVTRPLMECDELGNPQLCIAKAKVVLKSDTNSAFES
ncbi:hypothetical protein BDV96DRAFT_685659 [Lophiotrema nucula]|uniref:Uncharacterized protein n=1 Tax=Lophiotrema nucula TaxID=690887 RepID=A0A6A5ZI79_9PLEO|nr:hypothetical protein BDV96DRAFT_685659 [Lophiotrema nucula]